MLEVLNKWDTELFLYLNGHHNSISDFLMYWASDKYIWIPAYIVLILLISREYKWKTFIIIIFVALMITASDQLSVHLFKNVFQRLRPCHEPSLMGSVNLVNGHCGGLYGFVSSHAANFFALAIFMIGILGRKFKYFTLIMIAWAAVVSYSRIYLGVHYPGDVIVGAALGTVIGLIFLTGYRYFDRKFLDI